MTGIGLTRIDRYVLARLLAVWGLASLILLGVIWVNRSVSLFDDLIGDGQSARVFLELTALTLPALVKLVLPVAAFAATLIAVGRMMGDSEVAVMQAAGVSPWRLARPVLAFGLMVALLVAVLTHLLAPAAAGRLAEREGEIAATATARLLREGEFVSPTGGLTVYVREVAESGEISDLLLSDGRDQMGSVTYTAARAYLVRAEGGPQLVMIDGLIQRLDRLTGRLLVTSFADLAYDLGPLMGGGGDGRREARELGTADLLMPTEALEAETGRTRGELIAQAHDRLAEPLLAPVAALIALAALLAGGFNRTGGWRRVAVAVGLAIAVKGVEGACVAQVERMPALWPLSYLPAALGFAAAGIMLRLAAAPRWRGQAA